MPTSTASLPPWAPDCGMSSRSSACDTRPTARHHRLLHRHDPALMPEPGSPVTPSPASPAFYPSFKIGPDRGLDLKRSSQGSAPRRSVSSMTALFPLTLLSSAASASAMPDSPPNNPPAGSDMLGVEEPVADCNLPELLARDLQVSEAVFRSKSMTAGCPPQRLPISHTGGYYSLEGRAVSRTPTSCHQGPVGGHSSHLLAAVGDLTSSVDAARHSHNGQFDFGPERPNSATDSSMGMEPPSIRTRWPSITTAATFVSGRCSSLVSRKPVSPALASSSKMDRDPSQTWFDFDPDAPADTENGGSSDSVSFTPRPKSALGFDGVNAMDTTMETAEANFKTDTATTTTLVRFPFNGASTSERPRTASGRVHMEGPRIVEIQPHIVVPKRRSSLKREHRRVASTPSAVCNRDMMGDDHPSRDAPSPPFYPRHPSQANTIGNSVDSIVDLGEPSYMDSSVETPDIHRKPPTARVGPWINAQHRTTAGFRPSRAFQSMSLPRIPLPPEVIDTLRISISCFPETMLLSSSLSIETIRTYSKKLKHGVRSRPHSGGDDGVSMFSFSGSSPKSPKRWNFSKLIQHRRPRHSFEFQANPAGPSFPVGAQVPVTPNWTSIKNIFPAGSDYLCDALYAHLVAYNYMSTLCPLPPIPVPGPAPRSSHGLSGYSLEDGARIPMKAASVLGLQTQDEARSMEHPNLVNLYLRRSKSRRPSLREWERSSSNSSGAGRDSGSNGGTEMKTMRDIQAGLGRCITLLVTTLKLTTAESGTVECMLLRAREPEILDPFMMRALCEAVRCSEESTSC
ncbi:hypothetical protein B0T26DRAFT_670189 [Lasiosphaeria miniovina]|uniref:Uncharacterized protein n=1 Tax=Lasiosphaeria miniovina TaxID=1954250 RepID=A0AA40BGJ7_9PEZI|nr:uncharacterized protein B0T26DRAFT_670189 [Lasiosphaeria miniovina]KAK0733826.1 hypothetical protein B0T26DRAFT_670189 [Lasiosphaeria miniovina]